MAGEQKTLQFSEGTTVGDPTQITGVTTVGTIDSQTKSANGAVISGSNIVMQTGEGDTPGLLQKNRTLQKQSSSTYTSADDNSDILTVTNVPDGVYKVTFGIGFLYQYPDTQCSLRARLNSADVYTSGTNIWSLGPFLTGALTGEQMTMYGISTTRIITFSGGTNRFELRLAITGSSSIDDPWFILEKLENYEAITTEWD